MKQALPLLLGIGLSLALRTIDTPPAGLARVSQSTATPVPVFPPGPWPTPRPSPTDNSDPRARDLLRRSDKVMNELGSMRKVTLVLQRDKPDQPPSTRLTFDFMEPDRARWRSELWSGVTEEVCIGRDHWTRQDPGAWVWERRRWPCQAPHFDRLRETPSEWWAPAHDISLKGQETLASGPAWVVSYRLPEQSFEGWFNRYVTEWIDQRTERLLREDTWNDDPFGCTVCLRRVDYSRFDEPILIEAPGPVPTSTPMPRLFAPALKR